MMMKEHKSEIRGCLNHVAEQEIREILHPCIVMTNVL
jgi:hypothetical protein